MQWHSNPAFLTLRIVGVEGHHISVYKCVCTVYVCTKTGYVVYKKHSCMILFYHPPLPKAARHLTFKKLMPCTLCLYALLRQIYINHIPFTSYNNGKDP